MKLLTKKLLETFERVGNQSQEKDPLVIAKFFHPFHHWTRYATEYDPQERLFFWYVVGEFPERWSFSYDEFLQTRIYGLPFERDRWFQPCRFSELNL